MTSLESIPPEKQEYSVTEISNILRRKIEVEFSQVRVRGEISGLKIAPSGHIYFSIKDHEAVLAGICWRGVASKLSVKLEEGMEIICIGSITTYPMQSKYQIIVSQFQISGEGALMALLLKRKDQLAKEGLFDLAKKKKLPFLPSTIGIITSPTGAVIRDIIHRLIDRMPVHVLLWPVLVQGEKAADQISAAIDGFNEMSSPPDLIIVARGGGSIEDLWAFNEEIVVRSAYNSKIPLISAVGHETDTTLIDYASDLRAPTPSAAAEMAVPVKNDLLLIISDKKRRIDNLVARIISNKFSYLQSITRIIFANNNLMIGAVQKLDHISMRFQRAIIGYLYSKKNCLKLIISKIKNPWQLIENRYNKLNYNFTTIVKFANNSLKNSQNKLLYLSSLLESYNYKKTLERGFSVLRSNDNKLIKSIDQIQEDIFYQLELKDGITKMIAKGKGK
jgi:exodeoxyribonuclease VII large subunit